MFRIVISYRRADSADLSARLRERLVERFGRDQVFMDIDDIPLGTDFPTYVDQIVRDSSVVLVVIGPRWLGERAAEPPRLFDEDDPVRLEVEAALRNEVPIIPLLVGGTGMPKRSQLPPPLGPLATRSGQEISSGKDFDVHAGRLLDAIVTILGPQAAAGVEAQPREVVADAPSPAALAARYVLPLTALLALVHYVLVMKLSVDAADVRLAMAAIALATGFLLERVDRKGPAWALAMAVPAGLAAAAIMLAVVGLIDGVPIVPRDAVEWQEVVEIVVTVVAAALAGNVASGMLRRGPGRVAVARPDPSGSRQKR